MNEAVRGFKFLNKEIKDDLNIEIKYKNELIEINSINKSLIEEIKKFLIEINSINKSLIEEIKKFNDSININKDEIISLDKDNTIEQFYKDIDELKNKLSLYPFKPSKEEKLMSVIFSSLDENILYSIICKNTEQFSKLEEKLYNDYPEYSKFDNYFMIKGNRVDKMKTLEENEIKNGDVIIIKKNKLKLNYFK